MQKEAGSAVSSLLVAATVHGRCLIRRGPPDCILIGFHGYAENAERHLAELERIPGVESWSIVSVQALHPFYNARTNEVVASWMTRQDRAEAIADNVAYVGKVVANVTGPDSKRIVFAGFSQGSAMAYRAADALMHHDPVAGVIILGGDLPPDVASRASSLPPVLVGRGSSDEWFTSEKLEKDLRYLGETGRALRYEGGHLWTDEFRTAAGEFLEQLRGRS